MKYTKIEGMIYCAYGVDISESKNIKLIEEIFENDLHNLTQEEIDEYQYNINKNNVGEVMEWIVDKVNNISESIFEYFDGNKALNPYNLTLDYWGDKIFYSAFYPWERESETSITQEQVEETLKRIADAFGVEL